MQKTNNKNKKNKNGAQTFEDAPLVGTSIGVPGTP